MTAPSTSKGGKKEAASVRSDDKALPAFWIPSLTPNAKETELKKPVWDLDPYTLFDLNLTFWPLFYIDFKGKVTVKEGGEYGSRYNTFRMINRLICNFLVVQRVSESVIKINLLVVALNLNFTKYINLH